LKNLKNSEKDCLSDEVLKCNTSGCKHSEIFAEIGVNHDLADSIDAASKEMRRAKFRKVEL